MIRWTTPTLECTIPTDIDFDYLILTIKCGEAEIDKEVQASEVTDGEFSITLTQAESSLFPAGAFVSAQINFIDGGTRFASKRESLYVSENLYNREIKE